MSCLLFKCPSGKVSYIGEGICNGHSNKLGLLLGIGFSVMLEGELMGNTIH